MPRLEVVTGINAGEVHALEGREVLMGRHPECQIVLRDSTVSRRHARITRDGEMFYVDDVGSQHGTRLNGELIRFPQPLKDGDEIQLSQVTLVFHDETGASKPKDRPSTIITSVDVLRESSEAVEAGTAPKWRALLEITRSLGVSLDLGQILPKVLENVFQILPQASRGCIMLSEAPDQELKAYAVRHASGQTDVPPPISRTITSKVMSEGMAVLSTDAGVDERFQASDSVLDLKMRSVICAPLIGASNRPLGMIHVDSQDPATPFTADDLDVLVNIANLVGQAVDHARLHETALEFARRQRDLDTARQVQMHFLPRDRPHIEGYRLCDYYRPADAVGGDYFGYTLLPGGQLAIAVGDVAGHGIPAALLMARLCSEARYCLVTSPTPSDAVGALNRQLSRTELTFFITFAVCVLDPTRHELTVVNAGHMPPLHIQSDSGNVRTLGDEAARQPLGIDDQIEYGQMTYPLAPGDVVIMYTDGVTEARNRQGEMYGLKRLADVISDCRDAAAAVEKLLADLRQFTGEQTQEDDICIVALSRNQESRPEDTPANRDERTANGKAP